MPERFNLVVIGGGPAGEKAAVQAAYFGKSVALIEKASEPGGAGVHTGTLPSKTLRETAIYLSGFRARELYGVSVKLEDRRAAVPKLIARKDTIAAVETARIRENLARHDVTYENGHARFIDANTVDIERPDGSHQVFQADVVLVATGSVPRRPPEIHIEDPEVYDSDEILQISRLPTVLTVVGGGVIGCEYACMFAALGVKVRLVEAKTAILPFIDTEIVERLTLAMRGLGIEFCFGRKWSHVDRRGSDIVCVLEDKTELSADALLFAAGRVGNTQDLGLDRVGLAPDARGALKVNEHYQTSVSNIYAVGDVIGFPALASVSMEQARVAMCHAFDLRYKTSVASLLPYGIYTIPEVSSIGESEESCVQNNIPHVVGRAFYKENARGQITGDVDGMTKLIVHAQTRKVLGVHVIGERATELVHIGQAVLHLGGTVDVFIDMVFNYPTLAESYKYAAYSALGALAPGSSAHKA